MRSLFLRSFQSVKINRLFLGSVLSVKSPSFSCSLYFVLAFYIVVSLLSGYDNKSTAYELCHFEMRKVSGVILPNWSDPRNKLVTKGDIARTVLDKLRENEDQEWKNNLLVKRLLELGH